MGPIKNVDICHTILHQRFERWYCSHSKERTYCWDSKGTRYSACHWKLCWKCCDL